MSPRSQEFIEQARDRATVATGLLEGDHLEAAVSAAHYSMLYAARAALSERDEHAWTHRGTWNLFRTSYVVTDAFEAELFTLAQHAQAAREGGDYEAVRPSREEAERYVSGAGDFIAAIERMLNTD
jgi:uncharacterized protein (UPF0332 family)